MVSSMSSLNLRGLLDAIFCAAVTLATVLPSAATPIAFPVSINEGGMVWGSLGDFSCRIDDISRNGNYTMEYLGDIYTNYYGYDSSNEAYEPFPADQTNVFDGATRVGTKVACTPYLGEEPESGGSNYTVQHEWLFYQTQLFSSSLARHTTIYTNPNSTPISLEIEVFNDFFYSGDHRIRATGGGDSILTKKDVFFVASPHASGAETGPYTTSIIQGPNTNDVSPFVVGFTRRQRFNDLGSYYYYQIVLPPNSTRRLVYFYAMSDTKANARSVGQFFESNSSLSASNLFSDLTPAQRAETFNFALATASNQTRECTPTPAFGVTWGCEQGYGGYYGNAECMFEIGRPNGPAAEQGIEYLTEFPIAGEDICHPSGTSPLPPATHRSNVTVDLGSDNQSSNTLQFYSPSFPGYLSANAPTLPSGFPSIRSASSLDFSFTVEEASPDPFFYLMRYGSERTQLSLSRNGAPPLQLVLDGDGERSHRVEELPLGVPLAPGDTLDMSLTYIAGFGSNNGFYLDHMAMFQGPATYVFESADNVRPARVDVPLPSAQFLGSYQTLKLLTIGRRTFAPTDGIEVANEFLPPQSNKNALYSATFDLDEASAPRTVGVLGDGISTSAHSEKVISFTLNNGATKPWIALKTWGNGELTIHVDNELVGSVAATQIPEHNLYTLPLKELEAGAHTITLKANGLRVLDDLELLDRDAGASGWEAAPKAPMLKHARLRGDLLQLKVESEQSDSCEVQIWAQEKRALTPISLLKKDARQGAKRHTLRVPRLKRGKWQVKALLVCPRAPFSESQSLLVRKVKKESR
jgi:hypothetical protein